MSDFQNTSILVTGASGGIGSAVVRELVAKGAHVYASGSSHASLAGICAETGATSLPFDVTDEADIERAVAGLELSGLVNCAGWGGVIQSPTEVEADVFDRVIAVNTRGPLLVSKYVARGMVAKRRGSIVNVSSQSALVALRGHVAYASSKGALDTLTRTSAFELGPYNVRVNSVLPTVVMTDMASGHWGDPANGDPFKERMPLGRFASAEEIAAPIVFLLGEGAAMITGVCLPIDGGFSIC